MNLALEIFHCCCRIRHSDVGIRKAQTIAEGISNLAVQLQIFLQSLCVLQRVKADSSQLNAVALQLVANQVMLLRCQHLARLGQVKLKVDIPRGIFQIGVIDELNMHDCFAIFQHNAVQLVFGKGNLARAHLELSVQIRSVQSCAEGFVELLKAFFYSLVRQLLNAQVNLVAAIKANHAVAIEQRLNDFLLRLQTCGICAIAFLIALFQHAPGSSVHSLQEVAANSSAILRRKVNQYRLQLTLSEQVGHYCVCRTQPIAEANACALRAAGSRCSPFNKAAHQSSVISVQSHHCYMHVLNVSFLLYVLPQLAQCRFALCSPS